MLIDNAKHLPSLLARAPLADGFPKSNNSLIFWSHLTRFSSSYLVSPAVGYSHFDRLSWGCGLCLDCKFQKCRDLLGTLGAFLGYEDYANACSVAREEV